MTWHATSQLTTVAHSTSPHNQPHYCISTCKQLHDIKTGHIPAWSSRKLVHSKEMVWAWRWSVALRTVYRQILSLLYSSFFFWNFRPRLARELLVIISKSLFQTEATWISSTILNLKSPGAFATQENSKTWATQQLHACNPNQSSSILFCWRF